MKTRILFAIICTILICTKCGKDDPAPDRDKFLGTYSVIETCGEEGNDSYDLKIEVSAQGENAVLIYNLYDWEESLNATVAGNTITFPAQVKDGITFSGSGSLSGNTLTITYSLSEDDWDDNCSAMCTKK